MLTFPTYEFAPPIYKTSLTNRYSRKSGNISFDETSLQDLAPSIGGVLVLTGGHYTAMGEISERYRAIEVDKSSYTQTTADSSLAGRVK
jgi:hypothetical protein